MKNSRSEEKHKERGLLGQLLMASQIGLNLVLATLVGLGIGYGLDRLFNTSPWLTVIFLFFGTIAGFIELFRIAKKKMEESDKEDI